MTFKEVRESLDEMKQVFRENSKYEKVIEIAKSCIDYTELGEKLSESFKKK